MLDVAVALAGGDWDPATDWPAIGERAVAAALGAALGDAGRRALDDRSADAPALEVSVRFTSDEEVRQLNQSWRGRDAPTNILSFPMLTAAELEAPAGLLLLGDLVLASGVVAREADAKAIPIASHVCHLLVHGTLHLLGHDHQDDDSAERMEALEVAVLGTLGIADPYRERG